MTTRVLMAAVAAAALAFGLEPGTALANRPVYNITGQITTPPVNETITVNGQTYQIAAGSQADTQQNQVVQGETVQLILDGPPDSSTTHVVAINEVSTP